MKRETINKKIISNFSIQYTVNYNLAHWIAQGLNNLISNAGEFPVAYSDK
jgi:hypothetical protein